MIIKEALKRMRQLSQRNIPFSIGFIGCNTSNQTSDGYKQINKALLRAGYSAKQSAKHNILIAYTDMETNKDRHFYLPLLTMFNGNKLTP